MSSKFSGLPCPSGIIGESFLHSVKISIASEYDERWIAAELRTTGLLDCIQPNPESEKQRKAVADYVKRLIQRCFDCQVFTFGSVPLKTYLPDGDIDLTAFSRHQNLRDTWANDVQSIFKSEERKKDAEFCIREVQYIQAEVKIVKCLVENIVVDVSFNQLGGLCTLCFLDEVDRLIERDHLFKRSIILIKAWCYYESRLLGAHHGLISTYALETLVLYIFNVFHTNLRGPLEVLFIFLDYFSNFDWERYCVSLWGPVPLSSLPDLSAEPPLQDGGKLLLSKEFLECCTNTYAVFPNGQDTQTRSFVEKHLNVIDPLRTNNNLGRSVSKANFFRIQSAFSLGARKMAKIFESSEEDLVRKFDSFFCNTWQRHRGGSRPDIPIPRFPSSNSSVTSRSLESNSNNQHNTEPVERMPQNIVKVRNAEPLRILDFNGNLDISMSRKGISNCDLERKRSLSRTRTLDKSCNEALKPGMDPSNHQWHSGSVDSIEELSDKEVVTDSRLNGDAQDLAASSSQNVLSRNELPTMSHEVANMGETFVIPGAYQLLSMGECNNACQKHIKSDDGFFSNGSHSSFDLKTNSKSFSSEVCRESGGEDHGTLDDQTRLSEHGNMTATNLTALAATPHVFCASPHGHPFEMPSYILLPSTNNFGPPIPSLGLGTNQSDICTVAEVSSGNEGASTFSPPMHVQTPRGLLPSTFYPFIDVGNSKSSQPTYSIMAMPQTPFNLRDVEQVPYSWQSEQEQLQQLRTLQPWWLNVGSRALHMSPQAFQMDVDGLGGDPALEHLVGQHDAVTRAGYQDDSEDHNDAPSKLVMDACLPSHDILLDPAMAFNVSDAAMHVVMSEVEVPPFLPSLVHSSEDLDAPKVADPDPQLLKSSPAAFPSLNQALLTDPPILRLNMLERSVQDQFSNVVQGLSEVYVPAASFSDMSYCSPVYFAPWGSGSGYAVDGVADVVPSSEESLLDVDQRGVTPPILQVGSGEGVADQSKDLLSSDFAKHRRNLEFGRWCQEPNFYPVSVPPYQVPKYVHGNLFWDNLHRPIIGRVNTLSPSPRNVRGFIPGAGTLVPAFGHVGGVFPGQSTKDTSKYHRSGTGTFLPGRGVSQLSNTRQQGMHQEPRLSAGIGSSRHKSIGGHGFNNVDGNHQGRKFGERNVWRKAQHLPPGYAPVSAMAANHSPVGPYVGFPNLPTVVVTSSYEPGSMVMLPPLSSAGTPLMGGQLEFGSLGPFHVGNTLDESNFVPRLDVRQPSRSMRSGLAGLDGLGPFSNRDAIPQTPHKTHQRNITGTYELREDDFPPLQVHHGGSPVVSNGSK